MTNKQESAIATELKRLAQLHGGELQPRIVVDAARDESSVLHDSFTWDDADAGDQWRLQQARHLIRAVVTYEHVGAGEPIAVRVFTSLSSDRTREDGGYRLTTAVLSDAACRAQMLADARAEMQRFRDKYRSLSELAAVFTAIDEATKTREQVSA